MQAPVQGLLALADARRPDVVVAAPATKRARNTGEDHVVL